MADNFTITQEKKQEVSGFVDEVEELLEMAEDALKHENYNEAVDYLTQTTSAVDELDMIFDELEGYSDIKDLWRSGIEAAREGKITDALEDMRGYLEYLR